MMTSDGIQIKLSFTRFQKIVTGIICAGFMAGVGMVTDSYRKIGVSYKVSAQNAISIAAHDAWMVKSEKSDREILRNQHVMWCELLMQRGEQCPIKLEMEEIRK